MIQTLAGCRTSSADRCFQRDTACSSSPACQKQAPDSSKPTCYSPFYSSCSTSLSSTSNTKDFPTVPMCTLPGQIDSLNDAWIRDRSHVRPSTTKQASIDGRLEAHKYRTVNDQTVSDLNKIRIHEFPGICNISGGVFVWCLAPGQGYRRFRLECTGEQSAEDIMSRALATIPYLGSLFRAVSAFEMFEVWKNRSQKIDRGESPLMRTLQWEDEKIRLAYFDQKTPSGFVMRLKSIGVNQHGSAPITSIARCDIGQKCKTPRQRRNILPRLRRSRKSRTLRDRVARSHQGKPT